MGCASPLPIAAADTGTTTIVLVGVAEDPGLLTTITAWGLLLVMVLTRAILESLDRVCSVVVWFAMPGVMLTIRGATVDVSGVLTVVFMGMFATVLATVSIFVCTVGLTAVSFDNFSFVLLLFGPPR